MLKKWGFSVYYMDCCGVCSVFWGWDGCEVEVDGLQSGGMGYYGTGVGSGVLCGSVGACSVRDTQWLGVRVVRPAGPNCTPAHSPAMSDLLIPGE